MKKYIYITLFLPIFSFAQKKWTLQECIDYASKNNLQIIKKKLSLKVEEINLKISKNEQLPSVVGSMNNQLRFGQTQGFQGSIGRNDSFNNDLNISANILIYNGDKLKLQTLKKSYDVEITQHEVSILKENITIQIINQYLSVLLQKELVNIYESSVENAKKNYERAKITTETGITSLTTLAEAQSTLAKENQNLAQSKIEEKKMLFLLSQTLQLYDFHNFDVEEINTEMDLLEKIQPLADILENVNINHPLIKSAEKSIKSSEIQTKIVKSAFFPSVNLVASVGSFYYNSFVTKITGIDNLGIPIREKMILDQYKTNFSQQIGLSVTIPIFNKRNTQAQIRFAKINEDIAKNNLNIQKQELLKSIQKIYFDLENHYQIYIRAQETEKSTKLALEFAEKSYQSGISSIYDLNNARNNYINAQSSTLQAKYYYIFSFKILKLYLK